MESPPPYHGDDVKLSIPPLDPHFELFPENDDVFATASGFPVDVDFDFTFDDLSFADNLLLEQPDPNSDPDALVLSSDISQEWAHPNSDESGCGPARDGGVRVFDCVPVSSEESNCIDNHNDNNNNNDSNNNNANDDDDNCVDYSNLRSKSIKLEHPKSSDQSTKDSSSSGSGGGGGGGESSSKCVSKSRSKRKIEGEKDRVSKVRRGNGNVSVITKNDEENVEDEDDGESEEDDDKRRARLIRNRESAQLSRQRKKQYVEELEDKVRVMHSTINDLNAKVSYFMTENASLRQQLSCAGGGGGGGGNVGVYPVPPMVYPWMVYPPAYMVKHQGSSVPLVPIPRLKPLQQQRVSRRKEKEKEKGEGKTKKVASVSLFGLLFFMLLFGGIMPMVNVRYGRVGGGAHKGDKGAVFVVDKQTNNNNTNVGNGSEPLVASLFVPRNDKLVKIDGNLIIHSFLASEKAMMSSQSGKGSKTGEETGLAIHGSYPPYPTPGPGSNNWRRPHLDRNQNGRQRALGSGSGSGSGSADFTPIGSDGKLQQWFREGLAGPMLSSGMCTEVFQFDTSPTPGSIVPAPATATSSANLTSEDRLNSTRPNKPKNRRILQGHAMPFKEHTFNTTEEQNDGLESNKSRSSVVVSVLVDPREVGDGDGEGVIGGSKTLPRIFVVVLIDSVKYVTYSCMLPFLGSSSHLVTA